MQYLVLWILPLVTVVQAILRLRAIAEHGATTDFSSPLTAARTNLVSGVARVGCSSRTTSTTTSSTTSTPRCRTTTCRALHREMTQQRELARGAEVLPFRA